MEIYEYVLVNGKRENTGFENFITENRYLLKDADIFYKTLRGRTRNTKNIEVQINGIARKKFASCKYFL